MNPPSKVLPCFRSFFTHLARRCFRRRTGRDPSPKRGKQNGGRPALGILCFCFLLSAFCFSAALAADIQTLPEQTSARHDFTHAAKITFEDLNDADNAATLLQLGPIPTNAYVDRVAFAVTVPFTNSTASATNLLLCIGVGGSVTNTFFTTNQIDGSATMALSGLTVWGLSTNMVVPYRSTTSTNYMKATISAGASVVDTYTRGELRVYWRVVEPGRIRF